MHHRAISGLIVAALTLAGAGLYATWTYPAPWSAAGLLVALTLAAFSGGALAALTVAITLRGAMATLAAGVMVEAGARGAELAGSLNQRPEDYRPPFNWWTADQDRTAAWPAINHTTHTHHGWY